MHVVTIIISYSELPWPTHFDTLAFLTVCKRTKAARAIKLGWRFFIKFRADL